MTDGERSALVWLVAAVIGRHADARPCAVADKPRWDERDRGSCSRISP